DKIEKLKMGGFEIHSLPEKNGRVDLNAMLNFLVGQQVNELLVEAGPVLNGALLDENLVDEWIVYMAPCVLGDKGRGLFTLPGIETMADKKTLKLTDTRQVGPDLKLTYTS
ncbi:MAG TPA: dihydrofolate reductase family protein, partial [Methylomicrobium sp.]|nr:dihydrofolate reductase family protein [Methylomicrobium sp.]